MVGGRFFACLLAFVILSSVTATSTVDQYEVGSRVRMEAKINKFSSKHWLQQTQPPAEDDVVVAIFALKRDPVKADLFEKTLLSIATPNTPNYGKWLNKEQVIAAFAPSDDVVQIVTDFVAAYGVTDYKISEFKDMIKVNMPVHTAEDMLQTKFATFRSVVARDVHLLRITQPYSLPEQIANVVNLVDDILRFPTISDKHIIRPELKNGQDPEFSSCGPSCNGFTTPDVLQSRYGYQQAEAVSGNSVSVTEFQFQYYDQTDLDNFNQACGTDFEIYQTIGGNKEKICEIGGCVEALLDIEYIGAVAAPIPLTVIYQQDYSLLDWVNSVIEMENPPLVHSVSYGNDEVQQTSSQYMESCDQQFQQAGAMGLSIFFASGDQGVWGRSGFGSTFHPDFPAGSPYITAIGGTNFQQKGIIGNETAWNCGGGGFSDEFDQPSWQADAVNAYLNSCPTLPSSDLYNKGGRGYPDMAALGGQTNPYCVAVKGGSFGGVAGTSASCPVVAGIFAQLNDIRMKAGKPPLGWVNPALYSSLSGCFFDVDDGSDNGCKIGQGFTTMTGWDPATGLGTPNFECLASMITEF